MKDEQVITLILTIVIGVGVLLQAGVLLGMLVALLKTREKLHALTSRLEEHAVPMLATSRSLLEDLSPKVKIITANLVDTSATLRSQAEQVKTAVEDISARTRQQTSRVDGMVTTTLNSIAEASSALERGIAVPLRQVNGVLNGLRVGLETLRSKTTPESSRPSVRPTPPAAPSSVRSTASPFATSPAEVTHEEASAAAARFVRDRAAATSGDRR